MASLWNDVHYAVRLMTRTPGFTVVAVLILALGVGTPTAIFSVVNAVLLRPMPYADPGRLVALSRFYQQGTTYRVLQTASLTEVEEWRAQSRALESLGSFVFTELPVKVADHSFSVVTGAVDPELLATLGTMPALGTNFSGAGSAHREPSAIISHALWIDAFGGDAGVIGRTATVDGEAYTVIGVLPARFQFPRADVSYFSEEVGLLIPVANIAAGWGKESPQWFAVGRLARNTTVEQAQAEMDTVSARLALQRPSERGVSAHLSGLNAATTSHVRPALLLIMGISVVLLLIACSNIMNLLFSRSAVRARELAIRKAAGASTARLVRQMLTESACLTFLAGAVGLALARAALDGLVSLSPVHLPVAGRIQIDLVVVGFAFVTCAAATLAAGFFPALHAGRQREDLLGGTGTRASGGRTLAQIQRVLTVGQVALGLTLLTTAGLLVHSLWRLSSVDPGFRADGVVGFSLTVPSDHPRVETAGLYERLLDATRTIPGVISAGWITNLPPEARKGVFVPFSIEGRPASGTAGDRLVCNFQVTSEDYFATVGIPLVRGRGFTAADRAGATPVVIVNETLVRRYFPGEDPLGRKIVTMFDRTPREIVGIIKAVHDRGLAVAPVAAAYVPFEQFALRYGSIAVRAALPPQTLIPEIRRRLNAVDAGIPVTDFQTLDARIYKSLDEPRFYTLMAAGCAGMAVLFVTLGLYGVVTHTVSRRTAEIGIRVALGAQRGAILGMVLGQGLGLAVLGTAIGIGLSLSVTGLLSSLLFEVKPNDPNTLAAAAALVVGVTLVASYLPARRASKVDPMVALRRE